MKSEINISLSLDENRMPEKIEWFATDSEMEKPKESSAMMLTFWDSEEKQTLGIDLWTEKMMIEEMNIFYFQTFMKMSDTYLNSTKNKAASQMIENFANEFAKLVNNEK